MHNLETYSGLSLLIVTRITRELNKETCCKAVPGLRENQQEMITDPGLIALSPEEGRERHGSRLGECSL